MYAGLEHYVDGDHEEAWEYTILQLLLSGLECKDWKALILLIFSTI